MIGIMSDETEITLKDLHTAMVRRFDNVDAALRQTRSDIDMLRHDLHVLSVRISGLENRFDWVASRFERHDQRLEKLDGLPG
jgi:hypothetical protein